VGVLALLALVWWAHKRGNRAVVFGVAFFVVNIVFVLQILGAGQGFVADRFTYVAYLGLFFVVAQVFEILLANKQWSGFAQAAAAVCLVVFGVMTWKQCAVWKDGASLWTSVMQHFPKDPLSYGQRAFYYRTVAARSRGEDAQRYYHLAMTDYNRAVEILDTAPDRFRKDKTTIHNSRGKTFFDMGHTPEAIADYTKAIEIDPKFSEAYINRGAAYGKSGKSELALADFNKGIELDPKAANGYFNRSLLYSDMKKLDLAIRDHDSYLQLNPGNISILFERAVAKRALGRSMDAIADFNECLRIDPNQPDLFLERSRAYRDLGKKDEALRDAKMAKANGIKVDDIYLQQLQQ
jgi:tetratricopeptide (TPR) repeat protein